MANSSFASGGERFKLEIEAVLGMRVTPGTLGKSKCEKRAGKHQINLGRMSPEERAVCSRGLSVNPPFFPILIESNPIYFKSRGGSRTHHWEFLP